MLKQRYASQSGLIGFVDVDHVSPLAAPGHILALQLSIEQLTLQQKALQVLVQYIRAEREHLGERAAAVPSHPPSQSSGVSSTSR